MQVGKKNWAQTKKQASKQTTNKRWMIQIKNLDFKKPALLYKAWFTCKCTNLSGMLNQEANVWEWWSSLPTTTVQQVGERKQSVAKMKTQPPNRIMIPAVLSLYLTSPTYYLLFFKQKWFICIACTVQIQLRFPIYHPNKSGQVPVLDHFIVIIIIIPSIFWLL